MEPVHEEAPRPTPWTEWATFGFYAGATFLCTRLTLTLLASYTTISGNVGHTISFPLSKLGIAVGSLAAIFLVIRMILLSKKQPREVRALLVPFLVVLGVYMVVSFSELAQVKAISPESQMERLRQMTNPMFR